MFLGVAFAVLIQTAILGTSAPHPHPHAPALPAEVPTVPDPQLKYWTFTSAITDEVYNIKVYTPYGKAPAGGFPVIYVLDGDNLFGTYSGAERNRGGASELQKAIVVGISGTEGPKGANRFYDFTPVDLTPDEKTFVVDARPNDPHGGAEKFFQVIEREIKPRIAADASVDPNHQTLIGWSLGGQYVLHTLFNHPDAYETFIALSPSIWWGDRVLLKDEPAFLDRIKHDNLHPRIYIGVGETEQTMSPDFLPGLKERDKFAKEIEYARMVDNVRDLSADLGSKNTSQNMTLQSKVYEGQSHNSMPWAAVNDALNFAEGIHRP